MHTMITHRGDLYVPPLKIWLDPGHKKDIAFVSHAHADHTGRHTSIIASPPTARFIKHRMNIVVSNVLDYGTPMALEDGQLTLHPSGHILGAAQALVEWKGERLVYSGDFKLKPSRTAEPCEILTCDQLVMECTYGRPHYRFPERSKVEADILTCVQDLLHRGKVPIVLAYALGRSQEMIQLLTENGFRVATENRIYEMTEVYRELGIPFGPFERFDPLDYRDRVLVFPPHLSTSPVLTRIQDRYAIAVTGWAIDNRQKAWYRSDTSFPLSDHADFEDLIKYVELAQPKKVFLIHGFEEFAEHLAPLGIETENLSGMVS
jgi:Cft2 family RNA processing exonuclease